MISKRPSISEGEMQDYRTSIRRHYFKEEDFEIIPTNETNYNGFHLTSLCQNVIVINIKTGQKEKYQRFGHIHWVEKFDKDLRGSLASPIETD